jgi:hypothetical protein
MVAIAGALKDIPLEDVVFVKYPSVEGNSGDASGVFPISEAATVLVDAISADQPISLTGTTGGGTVADPSAPVEEPVVEEPVVEEPSASAAPDPSASPDAVAEEPAKVELPSVVEGQNASQVTCTTGQTAGG